MNKNNLRIIKNTVFLYIRMACMIIVALYTSRVILQALGVEDYGIYQTVGGIVGLLAFVNTLLSSGTSRFLTFEFGHGITEKLKATFSTLLSVHILIGFLFIIFSEIVGFWLINTKLNIPAEQLVTAKIVFQFTILTGFFSITQVPYTAVIIAHENMKIYAYMGLLEVFFKLVIALAIEQFSSGRLLIFAALMCMSQIFVLSLYRFYCTRRYIESHWQYKLFSWGILKEVGSFSIWNAFAGVSVAMLQYGTVLLLNIFFSPALVAARALNDQVSNAVNQFVQNFRTAANPQIIKKMAVGDYAGSKHLLLMSTRLAYYLMLMVAIPVIILAEPLLKLWLVSVPAYLIEFVQWTMVQNLFSVFDACFYTAIYAKGRLRENAILAPAIDVLILLAVYMLFYNGCSPMVLCYAFTIMAFLEGLIEKPFILCRYINYNVGEIIRVVVRCMLVTIAAVPLPYFIGEYLDIFKLNGFLAVCIVSILSVVTFSYIVGINNKERYEIAILFKDKLHNKMKKGENKK